MAYQHFSEQERYVIYHFKRYGLSLREIGRHLGHHCTRTSRNLSATACHTMHYHGNAQPKEDERARVRRYQRKAACGAASLRVGDRFQSSLGIEFRGLNMANSSPNVPR